MTRFRGMIRAMITTIDSAGRLVIPKEIRSQAGLRPGMSLEVRWQAGRIEIEPAPRPIHFERRGHFVVAVASADVGKLSADTVEETRDALAGERGAVDRAWGQAIRPTMAENHHIDAIGNLQHF
ncbi:MAG: AbrB/MazE/SpoVT family DNA-binding domain-containing protein [Chloroflexota bacterium]